LMPYHSRVISELETRENDRTLDETQREVASVLLYRFAPTRDRGGYLRSRLLTAPGPDRSKLISDALAAHPEHTDAEALWEVLTGDSANPEQRLRAAAALAVLRPDDAGWERGGPLAASALLSEDRRTFSRWIDQLQPVLHSIRPTLAKIFNNSAIDA